MIGRSSPASVGDPWMSVREDRTNQAAMGELVIVSCVMSVRVRFGVA